MNEQRLNRIESAALKRFLEVECPRVSLPEQVLGGLCLASREYTGTGFLTEIEKAPAAKVFEPGTSLRWSKLGARLDDEKLECGFLVYVDDGYLTGIEGYTYGEAWPGDIKSFEIYDVPPFSPADR